MDKLWTVFDKKGDRLLNQVFTKISFLIGKENVRVIHMCDSSYTGHYGIYMGDSSHTGHYCIHMDDSSHTGHYGIRLYYSIINEKIMRK